MTDEFYKVDGKLDFSANSSYDSDEIYVILLCLAYLEEYYTRYNQMTASELLDVVSQDMDTLKSDLLKVISDDGVKSVDEIFDGLLMEYNIPEDVVKPDYNKEVMIAGIDALVNQLRDDLIAKATFNLHSLNDGLFDVSPNFKRAISRINDVVGTGLVHAKEKSGRNIFKFVYGEDALFYWVCRNDARTCSWCRSQARSEPRPIDEWELDHPYGRCTLKPVNESFSDDYRLLVGIV